MTKQILKLEDRFERIRPPPPKLALFPDVFDFDELRADLERAEKTGAMDSSVVRQTIAAVTSWETDCRRVRDEIGLTSAEAAGSTACDSSWSAVEAVIARPARTRTGAARKKRLVSLWLKAGNSIEDDDAGRRLMASIAGDARNLTSEAVQ